MLTANGLLQTIPSNRAEVERKISQASIEKSAFKIYRIPKYYRLREDTEIVPNMQKGAFFFWSVLIALTAEAFQWKNEDYAGLKEWFQKGRLEDSAMRNLKEGWYLGWLWLLDRVGSSRSFSKMNVLVFFLKPSTVLLSVYFLNGTKFLEVRSALLFYCWSLTL